MVPFNVGRLRVEFDIRRGLAVESESRYAAVGPNLVDQRDTRASPAAPEAFGRRAVFGELWFRLPRPQDLAHWPSRPHQQCLGASSGPTGRNPTDPPFRCGLRPATRTTG